MRKFKLFVLFAFLGVVTNVSAQFVNAGSSDVTSSRGSVFSKRTNGWNRLYVSYLPSKISCGDGSYYEDDFKFQGFQFGWLRGFGLSRYIPLYMEVGTSIQYRGDENSEIYSGNKEFLEKYTMLSVNVPINILFRFNFTDDFSLSLYEGLDFRVNALVKYKGEYDNETLGDLNMFDDDLEDMAWKRFQVGTHIGTGFDYRMLHFNVEYGFDLNPIAEDSYLSTLAVTLGLNF